MFPEGYESFLVRIWRANSDDEPLVENCAEVEHIQSGKRWGFKNMTELLIFLQRAVNQPSCRLTNKSQSNDSGATHCQRKVGQQ